MQNGTMLQYFHWYTEGGGILWNKLKEDAPALAVLGISSVWLPPAYKATNGGYSVGYDVYDIYDLGEFDQKGTIKTKYGTKQEYIDAIEALHRHNIKVYVDVVLNHLAGADEVEKVSAMKVNADNRLEVVSEPTEIEAFTKFTYPGRKGKYSKFIWDKNCFTGVDYAHDKQEAAIFSLNNEYGPDWEEMVDDEKGNYDYLMYNDIEFRNPAVTEELKAWGKWYYHTVKFDGVRLDAVKHISPAFYNEWMDYMRTIKNDLFAVAEYWAPGKVESLLKYIDATEGRMSLFDSSLQNNFHQASKAGNDYNMPSIFENTLSRVQPTLSVTVVDNHDTQPLQALEAPVEPWFKPLAYALILLRQEGYPCVFYPDLYGAGYKDNGKDGQEYEIFLPEADKIREMLQARKELAYGVQKDYFDHANCIGWTRAGMDEKKHSGCAVILSNGDAGTKKMEMGKQFAGKIFIDVLNNQPGELTMDEEGCGEFTCAPGSVSVWAQKRST